MHSLPPPVVPSHPHSAPNPNPKQRTAQAYAAARLAGEREAGDVLLAMSATLLATGDFSETFTGAFEVANKVVELLMLEQGVPVCCTSEGDRTLVQRYRRSLDGSVDGDGGEAGA